MVPPAKDCQQCLYPVPVRHDLAFTGPLEDLRLRRRGLPAVQPHLLDELGELQPQEDVPELRLGGAAAVGLGVEVQGRVGDDGGQAVAHPGGILPLRQPLDDGGAGLHLRHGLVDGVHGLVPLDQGHGGFLPHPGNPGDVVAGVPHEGLQVDDVDGVEAVGLPEGILRHVLGGGLAHAGGHQLYLRLVRDELEAVLVPGDHHARPARGLALPGDGADEVVGLVPRQFVAGDVHGVQHLLEHRELLGQLLGHSLPLGLVALVGQVAEGGLPPVEGDAQGLGGLLVQQLLQGGDEAVDRVGVEPLPGGQGPHAVEGPVDDAVAVDDHEFHRVSPIRSVVRAFFYQIIPRKRRITTGSVTRREGRPIKRSAGPL